MFIQSLCDYDSPQIPYFLFFFRENCSAFIGHSGVASRWLQQLWIKFSISSNELIATSYLIHCRRGESEVPAFICVNVNRTVHWFQFHCWYPLSHAHVHINIKDTDIHIGVYFSLYLRDAQKANLKVVLKWKCHIRHTAMKKLFKKTIN